VLAVAAVFAFSFAASWLLAKLVDATIGLRAGDEAEQTGLDLAQHEESAYILTD
jgi:ammonium transporter, Amt family